MLNMKNKITILSLTVLVCAFCVVLAVFLFLQKTVSDARRANIDHANKSKDAEATKQESGQSESMPSTNQNAKFSEDDHVLGDVNAPVRMIIYEDFECPYCIRFYSVVEQARKEFGQKLAVSMRHYPLASHENAMPAAKASECAARQGKFQEMYQKLFSAKSQGGLSSAYYKDSAKAAGLDAVRFLKCMESEEARQSVLEDIASAKAAGLTSIPAFFVNGVLYKGAYDFDDDKEAGREGLKTIINRHLGGK